MPVEDSFLGFASFQTPPLSDFPEFGDLIRDKNPLHRDQAYAQAQGCLAPPVFGVALEALAYEVITKNKIFTDFQAQHYVPTHLSFKFSEPVYAGERVILANGNLSLPEGSLTLKYCALSNSKDVFNGSIKIGNEYPSFVPPEGEVLIDYQQEITEDDAQRFYALLGCKQSESVSPLQVAAQIPAALLQLSQERSGTLQGKYAGMRLELYADPRPGRYHTTISLRSAKARQQPEKVYIYNIQGTCYQEEQPFLVGEMMVFHPCELRNTPTEAKT